MKKKKKKGPDYQLSDHNRNKQGEREIEFICRRDRHYFRLKAKYLAVREENTVCCCSYKKERTLLLSFSSWVVVVGRLCITACCCCCCPFNFIRVRPLFQFSFFSWAQHVKIPAQDFHVPLHTATNVQYINDDLLPLHLHINCTTTRNCIRFFFLFSSFSGRISSASSSANNKSGVYSLVCSLVFTYTHIRTKLMARWVLLLRRRRKRSRDIGNVRFNEQTSREIPRSQRLSCCCCIRDCLTLHHHDCIALLLLILFPFQRPFSPPIHEIRP